LCDFLYDVVDSALYALVTYYSTQKQGCSKHGANALSGKNHDDEEKFVFIKSEKAVSAVLVRAL